MNQQFLILIIQTNYNNNFNIIPKISKIKTSFFRINIFHNLNNYQTNNRNN